MGAICIKAYSLDLSIIDTFLSYPASLACIVCECGSMSCQNIDLGKNRSASTKNTDCIVFEQ